MSESERDIHPADLATRTPPERSGEASADDEAQRSGERSDDERAARGRSAAGATPEPDPYAHHAFGFDGRAEPEPGEGGAPVIPLERPSLLSSDDDGPPRRVRIRKLRVLGVLTGLGLLGIVSTVFGMMMAVTSDLPKFEEPAGTNSKLVDRNGRDLGLLTGNHKRIFLASEEIAPVMKQAIIAIEDRRFYTNDGVDIRGIGRALYQDVVAKKAVQGGSTITQQFVKNALAAQSERTLFQKLREAALAYQITRKWSKERILRNYLNTIYFGNGAYGVESAAQTYFGKNHEGCGQDGHPRCAQQLAREEAALLAGMVASPSGYDPLTHRPQAKARRDLVLQRMVEQGYLTPSQRDEAVVKTLPTSADIQPPAEDTRYPYFTSWVKQQVVDKLGGGQAGARRAFEGGLTVKTTLDSRLQNAAEESIKAWLPSPAGPRASMVALKNDTGEVLAMVGGDDYAARPFNLATQGQRQPGSAFKPFVLAEALDSGISPNSVWSSRKLSHCVTRNKKGNCTEAFVVNNYDDAYSGVSTLARATTFSDNAVFAQVGIKVGTRKIARLARRVGIRTPVSHNFAMTLGGLKQGVTPLDMAHAYETFAQHGRLTYGTMSPGAVDRRKIGRIVPGPVGIQRIGNKSGDAVKLPGGEKAVNRSLRWPVLKSAVAGEVTSLLETVVSTGTAVRAQIPGHFAAGKTGTTENYGDAWFVGWNDKITVAVWVGYPDGLKPMETEFQGQPVAGGTFPAAIWKTFVERAMTFGYGKKLEPKQPTTQPPTTPSTPGSAAPAAPQDGSPSGQGGGTAPPTTDTPNTTPPTTQPAPVQPPAQQPPATGGGTAAPG